MASQEDPAEAAKRQAQREGLRLVKAGNDCGYEGVRYREGECNPYKACHHGENGCFLHLGYFSTKEGAALAVARKFAALNPESGDIRVGLKVENTRPVTGQKDKRTSPAPSTPERKTKVKPSAPPDTARVAAANEGGNVQAAPLPSKTSSRKRKKRSTSSSEAQETPLRVQPKVAHEALEAVRLLKSSDRSLTAKQVHMLLPDRGFELSLAAVKRLCSEAIR